VEEMREVVKPLKWRLKTAEIKYEGAALENLALKAEVESLKMQNVACKVEVESLKLETIASKAEAGLLELHNSALKEEVASLKETVSHKTTRIHDLKSMMRFFELFPEDLEVDGAENDEVEGDGFEDGQFMGH
jgi:chromosome segregation ATPase